MEYPCELERRWSSPVDRSTNELFDTLLTGGLGNWVQGLDFRKVVGNGNITSHRIEVSSYITGDISLAVDHFYLQAEQLNNLGGLAPISSLKNKELGHKVTLTLKGQLNGHLTLLGLLSYGIPGQGIRDAFEDPIPSWLTAQLALFVNY